MTNAVPRAYGSTKLASRRRPGSVLSLAVPR
jgi:hypothetical protein